MGLRGVLLTMEVAGLIQEMEWHSLLAQFSDSLITHQILSFHCSCFNSIISLIFYSTNYLWTIRTLCLLAANVLLVSEAMDSHVKVELLKNLFLNINDFFWKNFKFIQAKKKPFLHLRWNKALIFIDFNLVQTYSLTSSVILWFDLALLQISTNVKRVWCVNAAVANARTHGEDTDVVVLVTSFTYTIKILV